MDMTRVFIHGLESSSRGTKGVFFRDRYPDMIIEDFGGPLEDRMKQLNGLLAGRQDLCLVGSSFGGLMAAIYVCENEPRVRKVVLLAPALHVPDFRRFLGRRVMPSIGRSVPGCRAGPAGRQGGRPRCVPLHSGLPNDSEGSGSAL